MAHGWKDCWPRWQPSSLVSLVFAGLILSVLVLGSNGYAQVTFSGRGKNFVAPVTDAQGRKSVLRGKDVKPAGKGLVEITGMQAETFRGQVKDMTVEAPRCTFDTKANVAYSSGPLTIRTADGRFSIEGEGFHWQLGDSRDNSKLVISNQVHALVGKRSITVKGQTNTSGLTTGVARATAPTRVLVANPNGAATNNPIEITATRFEYQEERALFRDSVRVHEAEGDLSCGLMTVIFRGDGSVLERIEAEQEVVLSQGTIRANADKAIYTVGEDTEEIEFLGHAAWQDGDRQGRGERLRFDRRNRLLRSEEKAYLKVPRSLLGPSGFMAGKAPTPRGEAERAPASFIEVFADLMTIRLPATNGPVQQIIAEKSVMILDAEQDGRALADRAVYEDATGVLELTGSPTMETEGRLVSGQVLRFERGTRKFTAGPDAYVKLPFRAVLEMGQVQPKSARAMQAAGRTNQFIEIWAKSLEHQTNRLRFAEQVRANFLEANVARGKMSSQLLTITYDDRVEELLAERDVELEQFAIPGDRARVTRRANCDRLRLHFGPLGRLETAFAEKGVSAAQEETRPDRPRPSIGTLRAESVTAHFSPATNQLDRIVAEREVVFTQDGRVARGAHAVYSERDKRVELTGHPTATMPEGQISGAERLIWDRVLGRFIGQGKFKSEWKRPPGGTNQAANAAASFK